MNLQLFARRFVVYIVLLFLAITTVAAPAHAFVQSDLDTLQLTKVCQQCDLSGADLAGLKLTRADLTGANLSNANLSDASLAFANLAGANLLGAQLTGCKLGLANLEGARVDDGSLESAVLLQTIMPDGSIRD